MLCFKSLRFNFAKPCLHPPDTDSPLLPVYYWPPESGFFSLDLMTNYVERAKTSLLSSRAQVREDVLRAGAGILLRIATTQDGLCLENWTADHKRQNRQDFLVWTEKSGRIRQTLFLHPEAGAQGFQFCHCLFSRLPGASFPG